MKSKSKLSSRSMRLIQLAVVCVAVLVATAGQVQADLVITYQDVGSDLQFDYSGSLNAVTGTTFLVNYATASTQSVGAPVFYSASHEGIAGNDSSAIHTAGAFATNLPSFAAVEGTHSGTSFMFRLLDGDPGPAASSVQLWGDWGAANTPINGQLILTGQSAAGIGMVDGWNLQSEWGSITFRAVPEPTSFAMFGMFGIAMVGMSRRRRQR